MNRRQTIIVMYYIVVFCDIADRTARKRVSTGSSVFTVHAPKHPGLVARKEQWWNFNRDILALRKRSRTSIDAR